MSEVKHRHVLVVCTCGTVVYDCGCKLRLLEERDAACQACKGVAQDLLNWRRSLGGYPEVGGD